MNSRDLWVILNREFKPAYVHAIPYMKFKNNVVKINKYWQGHDTILLSKKDFKKTIKGEKSGLDQRLNTMLI